jgi:cytochrome o ubiquinol oxidase subunit 2
MNSFFVPQLGSQIYTMAGMTTHLNLMASHEGTFSGISAQFSGDGFSDMRFDVRAVPLEEYKAWLAATHASAGNLNAARYTQLANPSRDDKPVAFGDVRRGLFESVVHNHGAATGLSPPAAPAGGSSL